MYTDTRNLFHRRKKLLPSFKNAVIEECPKFSECGCSRSYCTHSSHFSGIFNIGCPWRWSCGVTAGDYSMLLQNFNATCFGLSTKSLQAKLRVPKKKCPVNYIKPFLLSVYLVDISTAHFS